MKKFLYKYILIPSAKVFWRVFKPKTFGVKAIILCDNEVLLIKNISESKWHLPGGGVYKNELSLNAIRREVKEELNFDLELFYKSSNAKVEKYINKKLKNKNTRFDDDTLLGVYTSNNEGKQDTVYVYVFKLNSKPKFEIDKSELSDAMWFDVNNILSNNNIETSPATTRRLKECRDNKQYPEIQPW